MIYIFIALGLIAIVFNVFSIVDDFKTSKELDKMIIMNFKILLRGY